MTKRINWRAVEADCRAGMSLRAMAEKHGVSRTTIMNEKDKKGWVKGTKPKQKGEVKEANEPPEFDRKFNRKFDKTVNPAMLPKAHAGNPTIKTPELLEAIFEAIAEGGTTPDICDEVGISRMTFYNWVRSDREFLYQYQWAKKFCADKFTEDVICSLCARWIGFSWRAPFMGWFTNLRPVDLFRFYRVPEADSGSSTEKPHPWVHDGLLDNRVHVLTLASSCRAVKVRNSSTTLSWPSGFLAFMRIATK